MGCSHLQATGILGGINLIFIIVVFTFQAIGTLPLLGIVALLGMVLTGIVEWLLHRQQTRQHHA